MTPRLGGFVFISLMLIFQFSCVIFYILLKTENEILKRERKMVEREATSKINQKVKQQHVMTKGQDDVIKDLKKQILVLHDKLKKLNYSCYKPTGSDPTARKEYSHKETKHEASLGLSKDSKGYTKTSKPATQSDWIEDTSVFNMFTSEQIFSVNFDDLKTKRFTSHNLGKKGKYSHLSYAVNETMSSLIRDFNLSSSTNLTLKYGLCRNDRNYGTEYDINIMYDNKEAYNVRLIRSLSPLILLSPPVKINLNKVINIIVPLQGRLETFQVFLHNFKEVCVSRKENVFLTVVYSGDDSSQEVKEMLNTFSKDNEFKDFQLVTRNHNFNRGHALHDGMQSWKGEKDVLMFFCDVDIVFDSEFLDRCRIFTEPGRTVYYPIVFNRYNPKYVRQETKKFWKISSATGFWRYYGYGMTCQHRKDYIQVGGFDLRIKGWGSEDVNLHHKFIKQKKFRIIRAPDSGLIHRYHTKDCDSKLPRKQYRSCMKTKIDAEASKEQYGRRILEIEESFKLKTERRVANFTVIDN